MEETIKMESSYVFGLDIGTRNVVGTVGYKENDIFHVVAQYMMEQKDHAMIDGQIHNIVKVGEIILAVKKQLEEQLHITLKEVSIAAAGRVLKTVEVQSEILLEEERSIEPQDIYALDLLGIEKAKKRMKEENDTSFEMYCVGYSNVRYYLNQSEFLNLIGHKGKRIAEDMIVTFLPKEVVDSLYASVELAGLTVSNMTLEPIASIQVAIPEKFRMLNIALVDVGAGTSDISITKQGSIIAYGMIPMAGDELTETIAQRLLVDFKTAEDVKIQAGVKEEVIFTDIMGLEQRITSKEVWDMLDSVLEEIVSRTADKIKELNGNHEVSAVFVVGGGGKAREYTSRLARKLNLLQERVALRGKEVLQEIDFIEQSLELDSLLVTPIGICLNSYQHKNNFLTLQLNGEIVRVFDNGKPTILDAANQGGFTKDDLFPKRGEEISFTVDGKARMVSGEVGESSKIFLNGKVASIQEPISNNCEITIKPSTRGEDARLQIANLQECQHKNLTFFINGIKVKCPVFAMVNGNLVSSTYEILNGDHIEICKYYTVEELVKFMDLQVDLDAILVNGKAASLSTPVYENYEVEWKEEQVVEIPLKDKVEEIKPQDLETQLTEEIKEISTLEILVNQQKIQLTGKKEYVFVDIFDKIEFDLKNPKGKELVTKVNGTDVQYLQKIQDGDIIEIFWTN